jgi:uncharacterized membrane protein
MKRYYTELTSSGNTTIFSILLNELKIKHTSYANRLYQECPHKYDFCGITKLLSHYGIGTHAVYIQDKTVLSDMKPPFLAQVSNNIAIVQSISDTVEYLRNGNKIALSIEQFKSEWSGAALITEVLNESKEPNYVLHKCEDLMQWAIKYILPIASLFIITYGYLANELYNNLYITLSLFVNATGTYLCYLLLLKQLHIQGAGDKICHLFKVSSCGNLLDMSAAKIGGVIGWSEIGLSYFFINFILLLTHPIISHYLSTLSACALIYSVWSIYYQKVVAKVWCPLCLLVQMLFVVNFFIYVFGGYLSASMPSVTDALLILSSYTIALFLLHAIIPILSKGMKYEDLSYNYGTLKSDDAVFYPLLKSQQKYDINNNISNILFGDNAPCPLLTLILNPTCRYCAEIYQQAKRLSFSEKIRVQYVFPPSSSGEEAKFLIASYQNKSRKDSEHIFDEWFSLKSPNKSSLLGKYPTDTERTEVSKEWDKHKAWILREQISATPIVLVNGYLLPNGYNVEDLHYVDLHILGKNNLSR